MTNTQREAMIRAAFLEVAEELIALGPTRSGSVTVHFQNGGASLKSEWRFLARIIVPTGAAILTDEDDR